MSTAFSENAKTTCICKIVALAQIVAKQRNAIQYTYLYNAIHTYANTIYIQYNIRYQTYTYTNTILLG
jgi:hypothetical protein